MVATSLFHVRFVRLDLEFSLTSQDTILQGALQAGAQVPNSCRNGTCRTCMQRLQSGQVRYEIAWPGLSFDEKQDGEVLICAAYACSDLVFE
jgi:ferredoxin